MTHRDTRISNTVDSLTFSTDDEIVDIIKMIDDRVLILLSNACTAERMKRINRKNGK